MEGVRGGGEGAAAPVASAANVHVARAVAVHDAEPTADGLQVESGGGGHNGHAFAFLALTMSGARAAARPLALDRYRYSGWGGAAPRRFGEGPASSGGLERKLLAGVRVGAHGGEHGLTLLIGHGGPQRRVDSGRSEERRVGGECGVGGGAST